MRMHHINLLPADLKPKSSVTDLTAASPRLAVILPAVFVVVYIAATFGYNRFSAHSKMNQIAHLEKEDQEIQAKLQPLKEQLEASEKRGQRFLAMQTILSHKTGWSETFKEFSHLLPQGVWFTGLTGAYAESPKRFIVKGEAISQSKMADFFSKLERSQLFAETTVTFSEREANVEPEIFRFELSVAIKNSAEDGPS